MEIKENTPNGKYNNILFDIENNIYFDEYFTNDILKPTDILLCYDERYEVIGCKLTQEEIFEIEMKKIGFNYKITFSEDDDEIKLHKLMVHTNDYYLKEFEKLVWNYSNEESVYLADVITLLDEFVALNKKDNNENE